MGKLYSINTNTMLNEMETQGVLFCQSERGEKIYYLNDTSLAVLLFLRNDKRGFKDIVNEILRIFDVEREECEADIEKLLVDLENYQIIDVISE